MRRVWGEVVRCCLASLGQAAVMFVRFFSGLAMVASGGKSGQGVNGGGLEENVSEIFSRLATVASRGKVVRESRGRSGEGVDEKSMAWGCEVLLGVIRDKMQ